MSKYTQWPFDYRNVFRLYNQRYFDKISMSEYATGWIKITKRMEREGVRNYAKY
jgi:hypothetical protein